MRLLHTNALGKTDWYHNGTIAEINLSRSGGFDKVLATDIDHIMPFTTGTVYFKNNELHVGYEKDSRITRLPDPIKQVPFRVTGGTTFFPIITNNGRLDFYGNFEKGPGSWKSASDVKHVLMPELPDGVQLIDPPDVGGHYPTFFDVNARVGVTAVKTSEGHLMLVKYSKKGRYFQTSVQEYPDIKPAQAGYQKQNKFHAFVILDEDRQTLHHITFVADSGKRIEKKFTPQHFMSRVKKFGMQLGIPNSMFLLENGFLFMTGQDHHMFTGFSAFSAPDHSKQLVKRGTWFTAEPQLLQKDVQTFTLYENGSWKHYFVIKKDGKIKQIGDKLASPGSLVSKADIPSDFDLETLIYGPKSTLIGLGTSKQRGPLTLSFTKSDSYAKTYSLRRTVLLEKEKIDSSLLKSVVGGLCS